MNTCPSCGRQLVQQTDWNQLTRSRRKQIGRTHARLLSHGLCAPCHAIERPDLAHLGGWERHGLVWKKRTNAA